MWNHSCPFEHARVHWNNMVRNRISSAEDIGRHSRCDTATRMSSVSHIVVNSHIPVAQVWLTDMSLFGAHNDAWNEWVDSKNTPVRACLHSPQLWRPGMLVEIMVTAAK